MQINTVLYDEGYYRYTLSCVHEYIIYKEKCDIYISRLPVTTFEDAVCILYLIPAKAEILH